MMTASLDQLLPDDHEVRLVLEFVRRLDLPAFDAEVKAVVGLPGRPPVPPDLQAALWLWATLRGMASAREIEQQGTSIFAPIREEEKKRAAGRDPFARRPGDTNEVANWRQQMGTEAAQTIYKLRSSIAEFPNAVFRNCGLEKVKAVALWQALAFNLTRIVSEGWLLQL